MFIFHKQSGDTEIVHVGITNLKLWFTNSHGKWPFTKMKVTAKYNKSYAMNLVLWNLNNTSLAA